MPSLFAWLKSRQTSSTITVTAREPNYSTAEGDKIILDALQIQTRSKQERLRRLRDDGEAQYVGISLSGQARNFGADPWLDCTSVKGLQDLLPDTSFTILIIGAGLGGLLYAVRMIEAGIQPQDIRIVDTAGDFGGTWYHNRYPGVKCDIESYSYFPLLEEIGYIPKNRYADGVEIREYAKLLAKKYRLVNSRFFLTKAESLVVCSAAGLSCTPGHLNAEGAMDQLSPEEWQKMLRKGSWGKGIENFRTLLQEWRDEGSMEGLEVIVKSAA